MTCIPRYLMSAPETGTRICSGRYASQQAAGDCSGGTSGGGYVTSRCCPSGVQIPTVLHQTISDGSGSNSYEIDYTGPYWEGNYARGSTLVNVWFGCINDVWSYSDNIEGAYTLQSFNCSTLTWTFTLQVGLGMTTTVTITV